MEKEKFESILKQINLKLRSNGSDNEWDQYTPVICEGSSTMVYLTETFGEPCFYNKLCHQLYRAKEDERFTFVVNSPGGMLDSAFMITDAIRRTQATTVCRLVGTVASAATIIALSCDELEVSDELAFMIHNYSSGMQGKGHEMKARQTFIDRELNKSFNKYYLGFLSAEEIESVIEGKDIWLNAQEVEQRWQTKSTFYSEKE